MEFFWGTVWTDAIGKLVQMKMSDLAYFEMSHIGDVVFLICVRVYARGVPVKCQKGYLLHGRVPNSR